jgi:hypothetical protein
MKLMYILSFDLEYFYCGTTRIYYHEPGFDFDSLNFFLLLTHIGLAKHRKVKTAAFILEFETETLKQGIPYYSAVRSTT